MDARRIMDDLAAKDPGGRVKCIPEDDPQEIVMELDDTPEEGRAIAVIDRSVPHLHFKTTEIYWARQAVPHIRESYSFVTYYGARARIEPRTCYSEPERTSVLPIETGCGAGC